MVSVLIKRRGTPGLSYPPTYSGRRPWYHRFRASLNQCETCDDIEVLLRGKLVRWRGKAGKQVADEYASDDDENHRA